MMKHKLILPFVVMTFLLAACQEENPTPTVAPELVPTETAVPPTEAPIEPTSEPTVEPTEAVSDMPESTEDTNVADETDDTSVEDEIAHMAAITTPPQLSERELGIHITPCELNLVRGADEVEGDTYYCGLFTVPQNWDEPDGRNLDLSFVVLNAKGDNPEPDPMMFLAGGPGQSALAAAPIASYDNLRPTRDIIRLDQRGTGFSQRLGWEECLVLARQNEVPAPQIEAIQATQNAFEASEQDISQANQVCWDQFNAQGLDLNQFNTASSARDVVEFVKALEYDSFNLHGVSYGTRLAMTIMNDLPQYTDAPELRSVVLDSAFPPSIYMLSSLPRSDHDSILQLIEDCQSNDLCREAYPNLNERLHLLLDNLAQAPVSSNGETVTIDDLLLTLTNLGNTRAGYMPKMIAELENGELDTYLALRNREVGSGDPEGVPGLDLRDPVQQFIGDAVKLAGGTDDMGVMFTFIGGVEEAAGKEDPLSAVATFINETYAGDLQAQLLDMLSSLTAEDFANSPYFKQEQLGITFEEDTVEISPEEQAEIDLANERIIVALGRAQPLYNTIHCQEDLQFENVEDVVSGINDLEFPQLVDDDKVRTVAYGCENWPVDKAPLKVKDPVNSAVPALILQGAYDKATPVYMGKVAESELENGVYILVPQQGHEIWQQAAGCVGQIANDFIQNPDMPLDTSCLELRQPQWALPDK